MKKVFTILILLVSFIFTTFPTYASDEFINKLAGDDKVSAGQIEDEITSNVGSLYVTIQKVGIIIALIVTVTSGVQWILATPAKKAELKSKMFAIVIGVALILLASTLIRVIVTMWENIL